jgi:hypothetical protein
MHVRKIDSVRVYISPPMLLNGSGTRGEGLILKVIVQTRFRFVSVQDTPTSCETEIKRQLSFLKESRIDPY